MSDYVATMLMLQEKAFLVANEYEDGRGVVLVDAPLHNNVGDQLILLGEIAAFSKAGIRDLRLIPNGFDLSSPENFRGKRVLFHGGGNFGDIYPEHDRARLQLLKATSGQRVELLPQTIYYKERESLERMKRAIGEHGRVVLHARDVVSFAFAQKEFACDVRLSPDMAHALWQDELFKFSGEVEDRPLRMIRRDIEKTSDISHESSIDWDDLAPRWIRRLVARSCIKMYRAAPTLPMKQAVTDLWESHCRWRVRSAVKVFGAHKEIVTSRLHAHILSLLIGRDCRLLDNSYGKNSSYWESWTKQTGCVQLIKSA